MVDISRQPYFSYNDVIAKLDEPLRKQADVQLLLFSRKFSDEKKVIISVNKDYLLDYHSREHYKYGLFEKPQKAYESGFHMWDHLPYDPNNLYEHHKRVHSTAHGLTIVKQYGEFTDIFLFATKPDNGQANNFYLNEKEQFNTFITNFYGNMEPAMQELQKHKVFIPYNTNFYPGPVASLSPRQLDCALLMTEGYTAKEIGKALALSHRTVEEYIDTLKLKFEAKNRMQLIAKLQKHL